MKFSRETVGQSGTRISYLDTGGNAPVVVFLHGLAGSAQEFIPSAEALWPEYRCVLVDQRGHGHSTRVPSDMGRQAFVDDVAAVIDVVASSHPVVLVGQSMGAHTALLTAAAHPQRVAGLVLLEADVHGGTWRRQGLWVHSSARGPRPSDQWPMPPNFSVTVPWPGPGWRIFNTLATGFVLGSTRRSCKPSSRPCTFRAGRSGRW